MTEENLSIRGKNVVSMKNASISKRSACCPTSAVFPLVFSKSDFDRTTHAWIPGEETRTLLLVRTMMSVLSENGTVLVGSGSKIC